MKRKLNYGDVGAPKPDELKEAPLVLRANDQPMLRTQIYLNRSEYDFVQAEAARRGEPMAAVIRRFIDEKMEVPEDVWTNNPMLQAAPEDPTWEGHEDSSINHDHYVYGSPKRFEKENGKWAESPALPDDHYEKPADQAVRPSKTKR